MSKNLERVETAVTHQPKASVAEIFEMVRGVDPTAMAGVLNGLLDFQIRVDDRTSSQIFTQKMIACQREMPRIDPTGKILNADKTIRSRYAMLEDLWDACKPKWEEFGFSISFREIPTDATTLRIEAIVMHEGGHRESYTLSSKISSINSATAGQNMTGTKTTLKRQLVMDIFSIVQEGKDRDMQPEYITLDQKDTLTTLLKDAGAMRSEVAKFCKIYQASELAQIPADKFKDAVMRIKQMTGEPR